MIALGCIADDFTGGTDVAAALRRAGMTVTLRFDVPGPGTAVPATDAVVVALKTRTLPVAEAVRQSLDALAWLRGHGLRRLYFKYCSTFDSTDEGNIGPVADALVEALGSPIPVLVCPASPEHGRTTYQGHLFVGDRLLSDSSMRHHPLTPMTDSRLVDVLARQTDARVDLLPLATVSQGPAAVEARLAVLRSDGTRYVVVDAVTAADLDSVVAGAGDTSLMTGGAGLAGAWGAALSRAATGPSTDVPAPEGEAVVLAGSCSAATLAQVAVAADHLPSYRLDPVATPDPDALVEAAVGWLRAHWGAGPVLMYSSAGPEDRAAALAAMGPQTPDILERALGRLAQEAVALGAGRVVVAGGETSGAVVKALGIDAVTVAREADRGVPWCLSSGPEPVALLLKSGNFGGEDLLVRATKETI